MNGEEAIVDYNADVEDRVERLILTEKLRESLVRLSTDERKLLYALYVEQKAERQLSSEIGLPQKTINDRKQAILQKVKKIMKV